MSLKVENISKSVNDRRILRDFSLEVNRGEIFGLFGAANSGKSFALKILAEAAVADNISFDGKPLTNPVLFASIHDSAGEKFTLKSLFGAAKSETAVDTADAFTDFENKLNAAETVLLLDDPFIFFDAPTRYKAEEKLRETVAKKNLAVVLTTNDLDQAFFCDRVGILHRGEIIQTGTPREIYENPASVAVAAVFGRNNLIDARRVSFSNQSIPEFQTLTGDHRLQTGKTEKKVLGAITQNVTLAIRPEHISISFGASFPEDNLLKAVITGIRFGGATTRVTLEADGLTLEALVLRLVGLKKGDECLVGMPPDRILILKD